jgi:hypothetical protein
LLVRLGSKAKIVTDHLDWSASQKTFSTEAEAKLYAKECWPKERNIIAGTLLGPDQPARRIISSSQVDRWIAENLASTNETLNDIN